MSGLSDWNQCKKLLAPVVASQIKAIPRNQLPTKTLYHLSTNKEIPVFIPQVSARTISKEDVRVPRICTAGDLLACLLGYGGMWGDYYDNQKKQNGWCIYEFDFELAFKPSKELLPDQEETNEYWLLTYNQSTREYKPKVVGDFALVSYASNRFGKNYRYNLGFALRCTKPIWIHETKQLEAGCWFISVGGWRSQTDYDKLKIESKPLDNSTYERLVAGKIDILPSFNPESSKW